MTLPIVAAYLWTYNQLMPYSKTEPLPLRTNTLWNAIGCFFYLGCQWLTTVLVVTLSSGYANSGTLAFAMSMGIIFASIALYKIRTFQVSDLDNEYSGRNYVAFRFITIAAGAVFCLVYLALTTRDVTYISISLLYLIFKADETFADVLYGIEQKFDRMDYIGKSQIMRGFASLIGFAIPLALTGNLFVAIAGMAGCCASITVFYDIRRARLFEPIRPRIEKSTAIALARACFLAMVASLLANSIVSVVRQYFGLAYGDELLGIYASVATPAVLIQVAATYLYSPMVGSLSYSWRNKSTSAFKTQFFKILFVIVAIVGILVLALSLIGSQALVLVFGPSIAPYTYLFPFVLVATGAIGILFYINDVLIILRRTVAMLACNAIALTASLVSAFVIVPNFGMNGINFAIILAAATGSLLGIGVIAKARNRVD